MENNKIKQNINCLEYPIWFQDEKAAEKATNGMTFQDLEGYVYKAGYKPPVKIDVIFLLYLLMQSQKQNYSQDITLTRYQILKSCGLNDNKQWYARLEDSLRRWKMVGIEFAGNFYDGESYSAINFGIIDSWSIHKKTKELNVVFSPSFITMMRGKGFFKYINFNEFKKLRSPLATRLYEILSKSFYARNTWKINAIKLAEKIPMKEKYPAHIVPKIKAALNRINENTDAKFTLEVDQIERGKTILCFTKLASCQASNLIKQETTETVIPQDPEVISLIKLLPEEHQSKTTIIQIIQDFCEQKGNDYVARNIRYTNKHAKTGYRSYLCKALTQDYGLAMQEDEEAQQKLAAKKELEAQQAQQQKLEEEQRLKLEQVRIKSADIYIESLSEEAKSALQEEAIDLMPDEQKDVVINKKFQHAKLLEIYMRKAALKHILKNK